MQDRLASEGDLARVARQGFSWPLGFQNSEALGRRGRNRSQAGSPLTDEWPGDGASRSPHQMSPRLPTRAVPRGQSQACRRSESTPLSARASLALTTPLACAVLDRHGRAPALPPARPTRRGTEAVTTENAPRPSRGGDISEPPSPLQQRLWEPDRPSRTSSQDSWGMV